MANPSDTVQPAQGYAGDISPELACRWWQAGEAVLVDVRTDAELAWVGFVPGAAHVPWKLWPGMALNPAFGMDPNMVLSWHYYGGGKALLEEIYKSLNIDVVSFLYGPMPTQPLGWFKKPIANAAQIKGLKFRTVGLAVDVFKELGAAVNPLPGGEIVPALDRGLIDAAEFNNASSDRVLGFPDVVKNCMLQSFHQSGEQFEILFNKGKYDALPAELKSIIDYAVQAASADFSWKAIHRNSQDYIELKNKDKVNFYKTPDSILQAQLNAWDKVTAEKSKDNALFKKVMDSQRVFAQRAGSWQNDYMVDFKMAWNRYFRQPAKPAARPASAAKKS